MKIIITDSVAEATHYAADIFCQQITHKPNSVLGLATGSTPITLYQELIRRYQQQDLSLAEVTTFNLDEYIGIADTHPQSYRFFMETHLFQHIDIKPENRHLPNGNIDAEQASHDYEVAIDEVGGIDLQILGLGRNGHIGFNEPFSSLASKTRIKTLTPETIADNKRFFAADEFQPHLAITMGIATIMAARHILLLATGESKAEAVKDMIEGALAARCPATILQMHPKATIILDKAAASGLEHHSYYRWVQAEAERLECEVV